METYNLGHTDGLMQGQRRATHSLRLGGRGGGLEKLNSLQPCITATMPQNRNSTNHFAHLFSESGAYLGGIAPAPSRFEG